MDAVDEVDVVDSGGHCGRALTFVVYSPMLGHGEGEENEKVPERRKSGNRAGYPTKTRGQTGRNQVRRLDRLYCPASSCLRDVAGANSQQGELPWDTTLRTSSTFAAASAVAGFASETQVRRGFQDGSRRRERTAGETRQEGFMSLRFRPEISRSAPLKRGPV